MFTFIKTYFEKRKALQRQRWIASAKRFLNRLYQPLPPAPKKREIPQKELQAHRKEKDTPAKPKEKEPTLHSSHPSASSTQQDGEARFSIVSEICAPPREEKDPLLLTHLATHRSAVSDFIETLKEENFISSLFRYMRTKGTTAPTLYKRANIDKRHYSKIISNASTPPTKDVAIAFAFALRLTFDETQVFISKAGYTLTHSNERDVLIEYCLKEKIYNIYEVNFILSEFKQKALGEK